MFWHTRTEEGKKAALELAKQECMRMGWPWIEPVRVECRWREVIIHTNADSIGCNAKIVIKRRTGEVLGAFYRAR